MIGFMLAAIALTALAVGTLLYPLLSRRPVDLPADRAAYVLAMGRQQLAEVERDLERGLIMPADAETLRIEIKRRMLAAADSGVSGSGGVLPPARSRSRLMAVAVGLGVTAASTGLYVALGRPQAPDQPLSMRLEAERRATATLPRTSVGGKAAEDVALHDAVARLEKRLSANPDDTAGWIVLGRGYRALGRNAAAAAAFGEAYRRGGSAVADELGEALIVLAGGRVEGQALDLMEEAHNADPLNMSARFYLALGRAQAGDMRMAIQGWVDMLALAPANVPWRAVVTDHISRAASVLGLDAEAIRPTSEAEALRRQVLEFEAAVAGTGVADAEGPRLMPAEEWAKMVRGMVQRLAVQLASDPNDRDAWLRLARAYEVLGETAKAHEARARAAALSPHGG